MTIASVEKLMNYFNNHNNNNNNHNNNNVHLSEYIYHALIDDLSAHMIHINLNMIFYTHVEHSPTKTIYIKY